MITQFGESFFLHRCIDDAFEPLMYIVAGNGTKIPTKSDLKLGNELFRKRSVAEVDLKNKQVILSASFTIDEIKQVTEIGVLTLNSSGKDILISHDIYTKLDESVFSGANGDVNIEYAFQFTTSFQKKGWKLSDEINEIYYAYEENKIVRIFENESGYRKVSSLDKLKEVKGGYYYDIPSKNVYIKPIGDLDNSTIIVQV